MNKFTLCVCLCFYLCISLQNTDHIYTWIAICLMVFTYEDIKSHCKTVQMILIYFVSSFSSSTPEFLLPWARAWLILSEKSCPLLQRSSLQANDLQHSNLNFLPDLGIHLASPMCVCSHIGRCILNHWATWEASQYLNSNVSKASGLLCYQLNWLSQPLQLCPSSFILDFVLIRRKLKGVFFLVAIMFIVEAITLHLTVHSAF